MIFVINSQRLNNINNEIMEEECFQIIYYKFCGSLRINLECIVNDNVTT